MRLSRILLSGRNPARQGRAKYLNQSPDPGAASACPLFPQNYLQENITGWVSPFHEVSQLAQNGNSDEH